eukprot:SM000417S15263  [mRNA]  locus=s417:34000:35540:+ [translate_table: standard]
MAAATAAAAVIAPAAAPAASFDGLRRSSAVAAPRLAAKTTRSSTLKVSCSTQEEPASSRRAVLLTALATSALLTRGSQANAASGPGTPGAKRTAEKADDLNKAADELINQDSPPRFGGARENAPDESFGSLTQKAGSGPKDVQKKIEGPGSLSTAGDIGGAANISDIGEKARQLYANASATMKSVKATVNGK